MSFFETRLAFRRIWVKEPRHPETNWPKRATSIVERVKYEYKTALTFPERAVLVFRTSAYKCWPGCANYFFFDVIIRVKVLFELHVRGAQKISHHPYKALLDYCRCEAEKTLNRRKRIEVKANEIPTYRVRKGMHLVFMIWYHSTFT